MDTLVVSDLHLGSRPGHDVLRRPVPLRRLLDACADVDRLVLLGDVVELWEGRPRAVLDAALPVLRQIGHALGPRGAEILIVPGNHDAALIRPWLLRRRRALGVSDPVPLDASAALREVADALGLGGARVSARYPGVWLSQHAFAHHGHYGDRLQAVPPALARATPQRLRRTLRQIPRDALPWDFERGAAPGFAAVQTVVDTTLPGPLGELAGEATTRARGSAIAALPGLSRLPTAPLTAPLTAGALDAQLRRSGLRAVAEVTRRLGVAAEHVVFGHVHRTGPLDGDDRAAWQPLPDGPRLHNTGSWVHEPLLLTGADPTHPYWPGGAIRVRDGQPPELLRLLDGVPTGDLRASRRR